MVSTSSVDIIILNNDNLKFTVKCVESINKFNNYPFRTIIVDNASTEPGTKESLESLKAKYPNIILVFEEFKDSGFAEGNNVGLKLCTSEYVLLMNNDILVTDNAWLKKLVSVMDSDPQIAIVVPKLLYPNGTIQFGGGTFDKNLRWLHVGRFQPRDKCSVRRDIPAATLGCTLVRRDTILDGLDESYWIGLFEDLDFSLKVRSQGFRIVYAPEVEIYHYESATIMRNQLLLKDTLERNGRKFYGRWGNWLGGDMSSKPELYGGFEV